MLALMTVVLKAITDLFRKNTEDVHILQLLLNISPAIKPRKFSSHLSLWLQGPRNMCYEQGPLPGVTQKKHQQDLQVGMKNSLSLLHAEFCFFCIVPSQVLKQHSWKGQRKESWKTRFNVSRSGILKHLKLQSNSYSMLSVCGRVTAISVPESTHFHTLMCVEFF